MFVIQNDCLDHMINRDLHFVLAIVNQIFISELVHFLGYSVLLVMYVNIWYFSHPKPAAHIVQYFVVNVKQGFADLCLQLR